MPGENSLKKELGLFDVFAVSTGAMFSSGFFLLPGLAAAKAGPAVILAYLISGLLILPALFSKSELCTALPKAGGTYFFLDRSLGPMVGTIGGLGTYFALTLKTAFALIGIGAYAALFFDDIPIKTVAIVLTVIFMVLNIVGARETSGLQRVLVAVLLAVLAFFVVQGISHLLFVQPAAETKARFSPFLTHGIEGLLGTIGFVFVSYAGLTKVASIAEEVKDPERNIPLGMMLSLGVTSFIYVVGVFILVAVIAPSTLHSDLTPVATASGVISTWLPAPVALALIVAAAIAAFASTGNAGLMSASRYPLAMARDKLLPERFARIGRFRTPTFAIITTSLVMVACILLLDAEKIAKLASAFQLFIFILVNLAVVVMRESKIASYDPGYKSPLYPWMQVFGIVTSLVLIVYMGVMAILFTLGIVLICLFWYFFYAAKRDLKRDGAVFHWFSRLGERQYHGLDREFRGIMIEKGLRTEDPFDEIVARSDVIDLTEQCSFEEVLEMASEKFASRLPRTRSEILDRFRQGTLTGETPVTKFIALPHFRLPGIEQAQMVVVRSKDRIVFPSDNPATAIDERETDIHAVFFLVSPDQDPAQHLRVLSQLARRVGEDGFETEWMKARGKGALKEILLRDEHFLSIPIELGKVAFELTGALIKDLTDFEGSLVAMVARDGHVVIPSGDTRVCSGDRLVVIGTPEKLAVLNRKYNVNRE